MIDLPRFVELWAENEARLDVRARARLPLARVLFLEADAALTGKITRVEPEPTGEAAARDALAASP